MYQETRPNGIVTDYGKLEMCDGVYITPSSYELPTDDPFRKVVPEKPRAHDFTFDETFPYLDDSKEYRRSQNICYAGVWSFALWVNRIRYGLKIKGRKNLRNARKLFKDGAMTVCNHVYRWDMLCVLDATRHRARIPMYNRHFFGTDYWFLHNIGGVPLPDTTGGLRAFDEAFNEFHKRKEWIHVFPESCSWPFYTPIRPFKIGAFNMAWRYDLPVIPMAISWRERKGLYKLFGKEPLATLSVGTPIIPDKTSSRKADSERMRREAHSQMVSLAGISNNPWPAAID